MGQDWLEEIRLDWSQFNKVDTRTNVKLENVLSKHSVLFEPGLGTIGGVKAKLYLKEGARPRFCRACTVPFPIRSKVEVEIDRQVAKGVLEPVKFSEWATPVVPIMKKDGSVRLCGGC